MRNNYLLGLGGALLATTSLSSAASAATVYVQTNTPGTAGCHPGARSRRVYEHRDCETDRRAAVRNGRSDGNQHSRTDDRWSEVLEWLRRIAEAERDLDRHGRAVRNDVVERQFQWQRQAVG